MTESAQWGRFSENLNVSNYIYKCKKNHKTTKNSESDEKKQKSLEYALVLVVQWVDLNSETSSHPNTVKPQTGKN